MTKEEQKLLEQFGASLRALRTSRDLSLQELAALAGVPEAAIASAEAGVDVSLRDAIELAKALGVRLGDLLDDREAYRP